MFVYVFSVKDPDNYLTYFRRATVYLALGKSKSALPDLDKCVQLRPGFAAVSLVYKLTYMLFCCFDSCQDPT